jgi:hypothetical protein
MKVSLGLALVGLALAAQGAGAQTACDDLKSFFSKPPKIGDWAELSMPSKNPKEPTMARISFVGKEARNGRELYRMQMVQTVKGQRQVIQILTPWDASVLTDKQDYDGEFVMKMGDNPAMVMPVKKDENKTGLYDLRETCGEIKYMGDETVAVPAGSFKARHYTGPDGDSWVSADVPGWHMVKMVTKEGKTMELTAMGSGAKNEITEKPMDMKAMMSNPEAMKKMMESQKGESNK